jgi:hypothetical protein
VYSAAPRGRQTTAPLYNFNQQILKTERELFYTGTLARMRIQRRTQTRACRQNAAIAAKALTGT